MQLRSHENHSSSLLTARNQIGAAVPGRVRPVSGAGRRAIHDATKHDWGLDSRKFSFHRDLSADSEYFAL